MKINIVLLWQVIKTSSVDKNRFIKSLVKAKLWKTYVRNFYKIVNAIFILQCYSLYCSLGVAHYRYVYLLET